MALTKARLLKHDFPVHGLCHMNRASECPKTLRANFVLTKDRKRPYYRHFCGKMHREGSCSKAAGVLSKVQMLNLVLGVGVFSLLP